jgi:hypothetical protein
MDIYDTIREKKAKFGDSVRSKEHLILMAKHNDLLTKIKSMDAQDIRLICGEMTAQEMRTVKAVLNWVADKLSD